MARESMRVAVDGLMAEPLPYGLFSVSPPTNADDVHEMAGVNWMDFICGEAGITDWCVPGSDESPGNESPGDISPGQTEKAFNRPEMNTAPPVVVYFGAECSTVGYSHEVAKEHAKIGLELGEQKALEEWVMHTLLAPRAENVCTSDQPLAMPMAVASVECALGERFGGMGIIHVPRCTAAVLGANHQLIEDDRGYHTWLGNRVALGVGYQSNVGPLDENGVPVPAPSGSAWIYASGPIRIKTVPVLIKPDGSLESIDYKFNNRNVVAERAFVVQISCAIVACLADISCCC